MRIRLLGGRPSTLPSRSKPIVALMQARSAARPPRCLPAAAPARRSETAPCGRRGRAPRAPAPSRENSGSTTWRPPDIRHRPGALNSGAWAGPFPLFPSLSKEAMERREAPPSGSPPGPEPIGVRGAPRQVPVTRGCRFRARGPSNVGPGASRRSNAMPVVGHRTLLLLRTPSTTPSIERGCALLEQNRNTCQHAEAEKGQLRGWRGLLCLAICRLYHRHIAGALRSRK
jgi:hypothetical protein